MVSHVEEHRDGFGMAFATSGTAEPNGERGCAGEVLRAERAPVIDLGRPPFAGDRDAFLRKVGGEVGAIVERGDVAVGEAQLEAAAVLAIGIARRAAHRDDCAAGKEAKQIHEMTGFASDASPALLGIEGPVVGGQAAGVDVDREAARTGPGGQREVWLVRRPGTGMLGGMRALPDDGWSARRDGSGEPPVPLDWTGAGTVIHTFTHFTLELAVRVAKAGKSAGPDGLGEWWAVEALDAAGLPTLFAKAAQRATES